MTHPTNSGSDTCLELIQKSTSLHNAGLKAVSQITLAKAQDIARQSQNQQAISAVDDCASALALTLDKLGTSRGFVEELFRDCRELALNDEPWLAASGFSLAAKMSADKGEPGNITSILHLGQMTALLIQNKPEQALAVGTKSLRAITPFTAVPDSRNGTNIGLMGNFPFGTPNQWLVAPMLNAEWKELHYSHRKDLQLIAHAGLIDGFDTIEGARTSKLPFYKNTTIVELQGVAGGERAIVSFVSGEQFFAQITGDSSIIHQINSNGVSPVINRETALDYVKFFCIAVAGDQGTFRIVSKPDELPGWEAFDSDAYESLSSLLFAPEISIGSQEGEFVIRACTLHAGQLFSVVFGVSQNGLVEMKSDDCLTDEITTLREIYTPNGRRVLKEQS